MNPEGQTAQQVQRTASDALVADGVHLLPADVTTASLELEPADWERFRRHWEDLHPDVYADARGARRLRRYGRFSLTGPAGRIGLLSSDSFVQPEESNPLYIGVDRTFEPLTDAFVTDPVFVAVLRLLARLATALDAPARWSAKVHPFRVIASADAHGLPTPEGRHRDGVTLVSSLLVGRQNAWGGASSVFDPSGRRLLRTTLDRPGTLLLGDDRRTLHSVSPVRPMDRCRPAYRDVLVVTFAPG
ncbi:2OG-Fe dioxygenase family protein [Nocardia beijingensis]|uniref:2OG-Fe dioxygenase family protein n=1 Tax=Nocardia beijingensis TaxID=95162 RepID=UPI0018953239|nr:2OG-Fe dioxygenase family protein [Nocardia beijingensis]MBF6469712.1 2OG-Fe dioxygenase family protein [Nocardia beijingensis]